MDSLFLGTVLSLGRTGLQHAEELREILNQREGGGADAVLLLRPPQM